MIWFMFHKAHSACSVEGTVWVRVSTGRLERRRLQLSRWQPQHSLGGGRKKKEVDRLAAFLTSSLEPWDEDQ